MNQGNRQIEGQLYKNARQAYKGRRWWKKLVSKYHIENTAVVLMPSKNQEDNFYALLYLNQMLESRNYDNALILTYDTIVKKCAHMFSKNIIDVKYFPRDKAEDLMLYYSLYDFDKRLIVASLDEPYGRNGSAFIGKKEMTTEEIFVMGVYRVYPFTRPKLPKYIGKDERIREFLYHRSV